MTVFRMLLTRILRLFSGIGKILFKPALVFAAVTICATCMVLSPIQKFNSSDSLLPILVSTQYWTPFYWGANRYGMVLPLLAMPFGDPLSNFLVQNLLCFWLSLTGFFAATRLVFGSKYWVTAGATVATVFVAGYGDAKLFDYFSLAQPYGHAMGLCYGGAVLLVLSVSCAGAKKYWFLLLGSLLVSAGVWVVPTLVLTVFPVLFFCVLLSDDAYAMKAASWEREREIGRGFLFQALRSPGRNRFFLPATVLGVSFVLVYTCMNLSQVKLSYTFLSPSQWPAAWTMLGMTFAKWMSPNGVFLILLPLLAFSALAFAVAVKGSQEARRVFYAFAALVVAGTCEFLMAGSSEWIRQNQYRPTYLSPTVLLIFVVIVGANVRLVLENLPRNLTKITGTLMVVVLVACVCAKFGPPSQREMRNALEMKIGSYTQDLLESRSSLFAGDYWKVWPTVFHANLLLYERGEHRTVYGVTFRSEKTDDLWKSSLGEATFSAGPFGDPDMERMLLLHGIPAQKVRNCETIGVYRLLSTPWNLHLPPALFQSSVGTKQGKGDVLVSCSKLKRKHGFALYGPYLSLRAGRYLVSMSGIATSLEPHKDELALFDVVRNFGAKTVYRRKLFKEDLKTGRFSVSAEFLVEPGGGPWEFRLYYWPVSDLTIEKVTLSRLESVATGSVTEFSH